MPLLRLLGGDGMGWDGFSGGRIKFYTVSLILNNYSLTIFGRSRGKYPPLPNQWILFFACSDWLLKLGIVFAVYA